MDRYKSLSKLNIVAIFAVFGGFAEFVILSPAMNSLQVAFASYPFSTILLANTISGIVSVPVAIIIGAIANKVGFKPLAIIGYLFMIAGCYPFFMPGLTVYWPIILSRVFIGIGTGFIFPIAGALVLYYWEGKKRAQMLGISVVVQYVFAMIYSMLGGALADIAWNYVFLTYLVSFLPLIVIIIGLKDPKKEIAALEAEQAAANAGQPKIPINNRIWGYVFMGLVVAIIVVCINFLASILIAGFGAENPGTIAGAVSTCFTVGCMIAGLTYGIVVNKIGRWIVPLFCFVGALGSFGGFIATNGVVLSISAFLIGITDMMLFTAAQNCVGNLTHPTRLAFSNGVMSIMLNFGSFLGAYFLSASQAAFPSLGEPAPLVVAGVIFVLFMVLAFFIKFEPLTKRMYPGYDPANDSEAA
ncbi:MAG: MFS transporter [bacterium]|nr:MFS transporter [bacterium]